MVNLGDKAKDTITGFTGIVCIVSFHLNGCIHIALESQELSKEKGTAIPIEVFDIQRIEVLEAGAFKPQEHTDAPIPGGPVSRPISSTQRS